MAMRERPANVGRGVLLELPPIRQRSASQRLLDHRRDLQGAAKAQNVGDPQGNILLCGQLAEDVGRAGQCGRLDAAHTKWHQPHRGRARSALNFLNEMEIVAIGATTRR